MRKIPKNSKAPERIRKDPKAFQKSIRKKLRIKLGRTEQVDRVICRAGSAYSFAAFYKKPTWVFLHWPEWTCFFGAGAHAAMRFRRNLTETTCRIHQIVESKTRTCHGRVGSGSPAERVGAGSRKTGCQQNYSPGKQRSIVLSKASKTHRFNVSREARTSEILCKPTEEQNQRLTTGLSAVYHRGEKRALFLAAEQWNDAFLSL